MGSKLLPIFYIISMVISPSKGRKFVIPDIHGCYKTFVKLLERVKLKKEDQLFLLGDYIDRGPNSTGVIDLIIDLIAQGYEVYPLRGNHEQNFLSAMKQYNYIMRMFYARRLNCIDLLDRSHEIKPNYKKFMEHLPHYFELENYYLVHGGFDCTKKPFSNTKAMLTIRNMTYCSNIFKGKSIVFGHNPHRLDVIENAIDTNSKLIPLDNGCVYTKTKAIDNLEKMGNLLALNLDKRSLIIQPNID